LGRSVLMISFRGRPEGLNLSTQEIRNLHGGKWQYTAGFRAWLRWPG
jgi:hypothetical protein